LPIARDPLDDGAQPPFGTVAAAVTTINPGIQNLQI
jgi:hypothetical protein